MVCSTHFSLIHISAKVIQSLDGFDVDCDYSCTTSLPVWHWWYISDHSSSQIVGCQLIITRNQPHIKLMFDVELMFSGLSNTSHKCSLTYYNISSCLGLTIFSVSLSHHEQTLPFRCPPLCAISLCDVFRFNNDGLVQGHILQKVVPSCSSRHLFPVYQPANQPPCKIYPLFYHAGGKW